MQGKIEKELAQFHVNLESNKPPSEQHTARYVIATTSSCGVGVNLAEAISVSFLEPDYHLDAFFQGCGRHCRQGNQNFEHGVESFLLTVKGNTFEERIHTRNKLREQIQNSTTRKVKDVRATMVAPQNAIIPSPGETFPNASRGVRLGQQGIKLCTFVYKFVSNLHHFHASLLNASSSYAPIL
jgi:hypothetical protein